MIAAQVFSGGPTHIAMGNAAVAVCPLKCSKCSRRLNMNMRQPSVMASYWASHSWPSPKPVLTRRTKQVLLSLALIDHSKINPATPSPPSKHTRCGGSQITTRPATCISGPGPNDADAAPPSRSSMVCGTYHDEIPGPVATALHTSSSRPGTSISSSITLRSPDIPQTYRPLVEGWVLSAIVQVGLASP